MKSGVRYRTLVMVLCIQAVSTAGAHQIHHFRERVNVGVSDKAGAIRVWMRGVIPQQWRCGARHHSCDLHGVAPITAPAQSQATRHVHKVRSGTRLQQYRRERLSRITDHVTTSTLQTSGKASMSCIFSVSYLLNLRTSYLYLLLSRLSINSRITQTSSQH